MNQERMRGERAYWCFRGKFYTRAVFPPGEGSAWVLFSAGENLYWYTFSGGDSIPGRFFRGGGGVVCGGKLYATTPALVILVQIPRRMFTLLFSSASLNSARSSFNLFVRTVKTSLSISIPR